ncbi:hypothetical protein ACXR2T_07890 [Leucobacter sp. HY1910]
MSEFHAPIAGTLLHTAAARLEAQAGEEGSHLDTARRVLHAAFPDGVDVVGSATAQLTADRIHDGADAIMLDGSWSPSRQPDFDPDSVRWLARWAIESALGLPATPHAPGQALTGTAPAPQE